MFGPNSPSSRWLVYSEAASLFFVGLLAVGCIGGSVTSSQSLATQGVPNAVSDITVTAPAALPMTSWSKVVPELAPGCKRGIAFDLASMNDVNVLAPGVSWYYRWAVSPNQALNANVGAASPNVAITGGNSLLSPIRFTPMIWGSVALSDLPKAPLVSSDALLGFNEPNFFTQANLSPAQAAALWPQVQAAAQALGQKLVSPALNYCGGGCWETSPFTWLDKFFTSCVNCQVDYIAVHWYGCSLSALQDFLTQVENRYQKKIWLTEFACGDAADTSAPVQLAYMKQALPYLEGDPMVARYAWFTGRWPDRPGASLLGADGTLTPLGQYYVNFPSSCTK